MSWSLGEVEALARKAAWGGGLSHGLAAEAGYAVRWLEAHGLGGVAALSQYLQQKSECCPVVLGAELLDDPVSETSWPGVCASLLLVPFAAWTAEQLRTECDLSWHGGGCGFDGESGVFWRGGQPDGALIWQVGYAEGVRLEKRSRSNASAADMRVLNRFASRTYAPASETSRKAAGGDAS